MFLLSDSMEAAWAVGGTRLEKCSIDQLDDAQARLWQGAGSCANDHCFWRGHVDCGRSDDPVLAIVEKAEHSQFDALLDHLRTGHQLPDGSATLALAGTRFHGQRNRPWIAQKGNLHLCVYYRPEINADQIGVGFTMLPAVAVAETIRELCGTRLPIGIKWVNDIRVGRQKIAGVLTATQTFGKNIDHVVFGIGVNVGVVPKLEPSPFVPKVSSLCEAYGRSYSLVDILPKLLSTLDKRYQKLLQEGSQSVFPTYASYLEGVGEEIAIYPESSSDSKRPIAHGILQGIYPDLSLAIRGYPEPVRRGRLVFSGCDTNG